jgi:hypothetical protein
MSSSWPRVQTTVLPKRKKMTKGFEYAALQRISINKLGIENRIERDDKLYDGKDSEIILSANEEEK